MTILEDAAREARLRNSYGWERLHTDGRFRAEMALCNRWGMPHSAFLEWSVEDQEKALQYDQWASMTCPNCGTHPETWERDDNALVTSTHRCEGCWRVATERRSIPDGEDGDGVMVVLVRPEPTDG